MITIEEYGVSDQPADLVAYVVALAEWVVSNGGVIVGCSLPPYGGDEPSSGVVSDG